MVVEAGVRPNPNLRLCSMVRGFGGGRGVEVW